jgi:hypothetical protein
MQSPSPPPPPNPTETSRAQTASNAATATAQARLSAVDQFTPDGSLTYDVIDYENVTDGLGGSNAVPRYRATQTLSPDQQRLRDLNLETQTGMATVGRDQTNRIGGLLSTPLKIGNEEVESRLFDLGSRRLNPMFAERDENLRSRLANQGIRAGSSAYDSEMRREGENRNDAFNSLLLSGRGQAVQEQLTERNAPINEITALLSGSQVSQPNFVGTPNTQIAGTDHAGNVYKSHAAAMDNYRAELQSSQSMMGGLFGLASAGIGLFSDRRLKSNIKRVGTHALGIGIYEYDIFDRRERGVMSDEVRTVRPDAVHVHESGFDQVDYAALEA